MAYGGLSIGLLVTERNAPKEHGSSVACKRHSHQFGFVSEKNRHDANDDGSVNFAGRGRVDASRIPLRESRLHRVHVFRDVEIERIEAGDRTPV